MPQSTYDLQRFEFKRGSTFSPLCTYRLKIGGVWVPQSIAGKTIESDVRTVDEALIQSLTFAALGGTGQFTLSATAAETANWPIGKLVWDIKVTDGATVHIHETVLLVIEDPVTE